MIHNIYFFLYIGIILLWIIVNMPRISKGKRNNTYLYISGILLLSVLILRDPEFGVIDMMRYHSHYYNIGKFDNLSDILLYENGKDSGYWACNYLFFKMGFSFHQFLITITVFGILAYIYFVHKYSQNPMVSHLILLGTGSYTFMFYGLRQFVAISIICFCIDASYRKKNKNTIVYFILALSFHWSSLVIIPFLIANRFKFNYFVVISYFIISIVMILFSTSMGHVLTILFKEDYEGSYEVSGAIGGLAILYLLLLLWFVIINYKQINRSYKVNFFLHGFIVLCMIQLCAAYSYTFTRANFFYMLNVLTIASSMSFDTTSIRQVFPHEYKFISIMSISLLGVVMALLFKIYIVGNRLEDYTFFWETI